MRELLNSEVNLVSGAGIIKDDPKVQDILDVNDLLNSVSNKIPGMPGVAVGNATTVVKETVNVMDNAWTSAWNNISKLLNSMG